MTGSTHRPGHHLFACPRWVGHPPRSGPDQRQSGRLARGHKHLGFNEGQSPSPLRIRRSSLPSTRWRPSAGWHHIGQTRARVPRASTRLQEQDCFEHPTSSPWAHRGTSDPCSGVQAGVPPRRGDPRPTAILRSNRDGVTFNPITHPIRDISQGQCADESGQHSPRTTDFIGWVAPWLGRAPIRGRHYRVMREFEDRCRP